jgi:hypothetical protein
MKTAVRRSCFAFIPLSPRIDGTAIAPVSGMAEFAGVPHTPPPDPDPKDPYPVDPTDPDGPEPDPDVIPVIEPQWEA